MIEQNEHIDKVFRDKLGNYSKEPPEDAWGSIREGLDHKSGRKILYIAWRVAAGIAILITAGYLYHSSRQPVKPEMADNREMTKGTVIKADTAFQSGRTAVTVDEIEIVEKVQKSVIAGDQQPAKDEIITPERIKMAESLKLPETFKELQQEITEDSGIRVTSGTNIQIPDAIPSVYLADLPYALSPLPAEPDKIPEKVFIRSERFVSPDLPGEFIEESTKKKDLWSVTAQVSPVYNYRALGSADQATITSMNKTESGKLSYGGGFQLGYKATERLSFYGGLMYSKMGLEVSNLVTYGMEKQSTYNDGIIEISGARLNIYALNNSTGIINTEQSNKIIITPKSSENIYSTSQEIRTDALMFSINTNDKIDQYFQFLELPLMLRYKVLRGKFDMNLLGGVSTNILIGNTVYLISDDNKTEIGETQGVRAVNYSGNVGVGFDYDLGPHFLFILEPQFRYYLNSINEKNLISNRPYSFGMFTGIRYIF